MYWVLAMIDAYLVINCIATIYIIKRGSLNVAEMVVQVLLLWLVPVAGMVILGLFHWHEAKAAKAPS